MATYRYMGDATFRDVDTGEEISTAEFERRKAAKAQASATAPAPAAAPKSALSRVAGGAMEYVVKPVAETVLQPARAVQQIGRGIGEAASKAVTERAPGIGEALRGTFGAITPVQKEGIYAGTFTQVVKPTESLRQGAGQAIQAGVNLATPFWATTPMKQAAGFGALGFGRAVEEGKPLAVAAGTGALEGALGYGIGKGLDVAGAVVGKGVTKAVGDAIRKAAPSLTALPKATFDRAVNRIQSVAPKFMAYVEGSEAGNFAGAEAAVRSELLSSARGMYAKAKAAAEGAFDSEISRLSGKYKDAKADVAGVAKRAMENLPKFGTPRTADERIAVEGALEILRRPQEYTVDGTRKILSELYDFADGLDEASPARRLAMSAWKDLRSELSRMTKGEIDPAMKAYAEFIDMAGRVRPVWSKSVNEDTARNFVAQLESQSKGAAADAVRYLESLTAKAAKTKKPVTSFLDELKDARVARELSVENARAGNTILRYLIPTMITGAGAAVGSALSPGAGSVLGATLGAAVAPKITSPRLLTETIMKAAQAPQTGAVRQAAGRAIASPAAVQAVQRPISAWLDGLTGGRSR